MLKLRTALLAAAAALVISVVPSSANAETTGQTPTGSTAGTTVGGTSTCYPKRQCYLNPTTGRVRCKIVMYCQPA